MKKAFSNKQELVDWLKHSTSAVLLSVSLVGGIQEIQYQASSIEALSKAAQFSPDYLKEGEYVVEYDGSASNEEGDDLVYTNIATAFTFMGRFAQHPEKTTGGMDSLRSALSGFDYTAKVELSEAGYIGHLLILMPSSPDELESLKAILNNLSVAYVVPDGSGTINQSNLKMGRGLWA